MNNTISALTTAGGAAASAPSPASGLPSVPFDPLAFLSGVWSFLANLAPALAYWAAIQLAAEVLLWLIVHVLKPLTAHTKTNLDDFVVDSLPKPVRVGALTLGLWAFAQAAFPAAQPLGMPWGQWLAGALVFSAGMVASGIANALVMWYYHELAPQLRARRGGESLQVSKDVFPMARRLVVWAVYFLTAVVLLGQFGIEIGPLLAGLGIAGLAVGLALQDTLANFFSGLQLLSDKPIKIGEFIALESEDGAIKGYVEEVGWRTTRIRTRGNCTYFVPNKLIGNTLIVNFSRGLDDNWKGSSMRVGVDYSAEPKKVKEIIMQAIVQLQKNDDRFGPQEPMVRLEEFGDSALVFKAMWTVRDFAQSEAVAGEVREAVLSALRSHKIGIPYPTRTLVWEGKKPGARKK